MRSSPNICIQNSSSTKSEFRMRLRNKQHIDVRSLDVLLQLPEYAQANLQFLELYQKYYEL